MAPFLLNKEYRTGRGARGDFVCLCGEKIGNIFFFLRRSGEGIRNEHSGLHGRWKSADDDAARLDDNIFRRSGWERIYCSANGDVVGVERAGNVRILRPYYKVINISKNENIKKEYYGDDSRELRAGIFFDDAIKPDSANRRQDHCGRKHQYGT